MFDWRRNIFIGFFTGILGGIISGLILLNCDLLDILNNFNSFLILLFKISLLTIVFTLVCIIIYHITFEKGINNFCNSLKENSLMWFLIFLEIINLILLLVLIF